MDCLRIRWQVKPGCGCSHERRVFLQMHRNFLRERTNLIQNAEIFFSMPPLHGRSCRDTAQRLGGLFQLTVHLQQWNSHWEISRSCCERNLITCLPHLNTNEFWFQINPLWNFNYSIKAVICSGKDRVVTVEPGEWPAQWFLLRVPITLYSSLWFLPHHWLRVQEVALNRYQCFCNAFYHHRGWCAENTSLMKHF